MKQTWLLLLSLFFTLSLQAAEPPPYEGDEQSWMQQQRPRTLSDPAAWRAWQQRDLDEMEAQARSASGSSIARQGGGGHKATMRRRPAPTHPPLSQALAPTAPRRTPSVMLSPPPSSTSSDPRSSSSMSGGGSVNVFFPQDNQQQDLVRQLQDENTRLQTALSHAQQQQQPQQLQQQGVSPELATLQSAATASKSILPPDAQAIVNNIATKCAGFPLRTTVITALTQRITNRVALEQQVPADTKRRWWLRESQESANARAQKKLEKSRSEATATLMKDLARLNKADRKLNKIK